MPTIAEWRGHLPALTADQMREVARAMIESVGISLIQMMVNAGRHLATLARELCGGNVESKSIVVLAGRGNNGGGGLVAARRLANWGAHVSVVLADAAERYQDGATTAYGQLATDTDMAGTGHQDHHPALTSLKPNTLYHIRLQGVGSDGTLYASDDYTFRTPVGAATQPSKPRGTNIALTSAGTRVKGVSSNHDGNNDPNSTYGTNKAIDGDLNTEWSSNGDGDKAWIELDLGNEYKVNSIGVRTRTMGTSAQIMRFQVRTDRGEVLGPFDLPDAKSVYYFPVTTTARTLRFEVLKSSGGNTGAA